MRIEQALYGEARGGHALRVASGDGKIAMELTSRLDLPDTAPPGVKWSPFISGFPHGDRYVLARTILDVGAPRAGMVFSHALIAPLEEIAAITDLRPVLALLSTSPHRPAAIDAIDIQNDQMSMPPSTADLVGAAQALATRGDGPVVRLGHDGFEELVVALWARLWPEIRRGFAFRLSFGANDLVETPSPTLVCTPISLAARWTGHRIISAAAHPETTALAAAVLSGEAEGWSLLQFAREIGADLTTLADLPLLEQAYRLGAGTSQSFEHMVAALRLIERLSPDPAAGREGKDDILRKLSRLLPTATAHQVLPLRNLHLAAFTAPRRLWRSLTQWAAENQYSPDEDTEMLSVLADATVSSGAITEWRSAVLEGLAAASRSRKSAFADAFWRWVETRPEIVARIFDHLPAEGSVEEMLANAAPLKLATKSADALMALTLPRNWLRLHGAAASAAYKPIEAVHRQLAADSDGSNLDGLRLALRRSTPAQTLACALELEEPRLIRLAGEMAAANPKLLSGVDFTEITAQRIWALAVSENADAWQGPEDPRTAFCAVLDGLVEGKTVDRILIAQLSVSPVADLCDYPRRTDVWSRVEGRPRDYLLAATATGWLQRVANGSSTPPPERELQAAIVAGRELDTILGASIPSRIGIATQLIGVLDQFDEQRFLRWLQSVVSCVRALGTSDAEAIGRLILNRRWSRAADELARLNRTGRSDIRPALRVCYALLDLWTRFLLRLAPLSYTEKWELLETTAAELYPSGPDHDELWERAGGSNSDLLHHGKGRARWRDALAQIRRGKGVRVDKLLNEMQREYPYNDQLRYLAADYAFGGSQH